MTTKFPKYTDVSLQIALDSEITFPSELTELDFTHQIQANSKIKWDVNPFVLEDNLIRILLDASNYNLWRSKDYICAIVGTLIAYWGLKTWTAEMLLLLLLIPFTIVAMSHAIFIIIMGIVISIKIYFDLNIPLFWIIVGLVGISYFVKKTSYDMARRVIIRQALNDWPTFWKYYSIQIIYPSLWSDRDQLSYLFKRYPELVISRNSKDK